ncbi:MAG: hypothetical protein MZV49_19170 [Rhodopseudomonas palustris]|nr:hypothetical protein [Rhodopseudomonas palustris]
MTAGIGLVLIGLAAIGYGFQVKEFSFGDTLIVAGTIAVGSGAILLGLRAAVAELIAALGKVRLPASASSPEPGMVAPTMPAPPSRSSSLRPVVAMPPPAEPAAEAGRYAGEAPRPGGYEPAEPAPAEYGGSDRDMPPWQKDAERERERARQRTMAAPEPPPAAQPPAAAPLESAAAPDSANEAAAAAAAAAEAAEAEAGRQRRNLLFHSTRRERLRGRAAESGEQGSLLDDLRRSAFDEAWPEPERARGDQLRRRASEASIAEDRPASEPAPAPTPAASPAPAA